MHDPLAAQKGARQELRSLLKFAVLLAAVFLVFVYPNTDDFSISETRCEQLNHFWKNELQQEFRFTDDWESGPFTCPSREADITRALQFISRMEVTMSGRQPALTYYAWVKQQSVTFGRAILFGLAGRTDFEKRRIDVSPMILDKHNWVKIAGIIIHELRHLEQGVNTHVPCRKDPAKSCDMRLADKPSQGGAYSYNILFFDQVRNSAATTRYEKKLAEREMVSILESRFNVIGPEDFARYGLDR